MPSDSEWNVGRLIVFGGGLLVVVAIVVAVVLLVKHHHKKSPDSGGDQTGRPCPCSGKCVGGQTELKDKESCVPFCPSGQAADKGSILCDNGTLGTYQCSQATGSGCALTPSMSSLCGGKQQLIDHETCSPHCPDGQHPTFSGTVMCVNGKLVPPDSVDCVPDSSSGKSCTLPTSMGWTCGSGSSLLDKQSCVPLCGTKGFKPNVEKVTCDNGTLSPPGSDGYRCIQAVDWTDRGMNCDGGNLETKTNISLDDCKTACEQTSQCTGVSYNADRKQCVTRNQNCMNAKSNTGTDGDAPWAYFEKPGYPNEVWAQKNATYCDIKENNPKDGTGRGYKSYDSKSIQLEECKAICAKDSDCLGFNYRRNSHGNNWCHVFPSCPLGITDSVAGGWRYYQIHRTPAWSK